MNLTTEPPAAHAAPVLDPLRSDLSRLDVVLAPALATVGFDWPTPAAVGRRPLFALPGLRRAIMLPQAVWLQLVHDRPTGRFASTPRGAGIASLVLAQATAMRASVAIRIARERGAAPLIALHGRSGRTSLARAIGGAGS